MSKRNFEEWLKTFRESINGYDYYIDSRKILDNAAKLETVMLLELKQG